MSGKSHKNCERPIFVGASGRRLRTLRVAGAMVVLPAVGFVGVLLIALIGGFLLHSPLLPSAAPPKASVAPRPPRPEPAGQPSSDSPTSVFVVVSVPNGRQIRGLTPPVATPSTTSMSKGRPVLGVVKSAEKARPGPAVAAAVTPRGRPAVAAAKARAGVTSKGVPVAKGRPAVAAAKARTGVTSKGVAVAKATTRVTSKGVAVAKATNKVTSKGGLAALPTPLRRPIRAGR